MMAVEPLVHASYTRVYANATPCFLNPAHDSQRDNRDWVYSSSRQPDWRSSRNIGSQTSHKALHTPGRVIDGPPGSSLSSGSDCSYQRPLGRRDIINRNSNPSGTIHVGFPQQSSCQSFRALLVPSTLNCFWKA